MPSTNFPLPQSHADQPTQPDFEDCTPCRVMGSATFVGLGIYTLTLRPEPTSAALHKPWVRALNRYAPQMRGGLGAGFILLGIWRLVN